MAQNLHNVLQSKNRKKERKKKRMKKSLHHDLLSQICQNWIQLFKNNYYCISSHSWDLWLLRPLSESIFCISLSFFSSPPFVFSPSLFIFYLFMDFTLGSQTPSEKGIRVVILIKTFPISMCIYYQAYQFTHQWSNKEKHWDIPFC